jgi:hypothetical protein
VPSADDEEEKSNIPTEEETNYEEEDQDLIQNTSDLASENSEVQLEEVEEQPPTPRHPVVAFMFKAIKTMLLPFCRILFAPAAQKTFVKMTVMILTVACIIVTGMFAYIVFYNQYVPPITHVQPIWFQYGLAPNIASQTSGPRATVDILSGKSVVSLSYNAYLLFI